MTRAFSALIALALLSAPAQSATYWVAPDSTLGLGIGSPYRTGSDTSSAFPDGPTTLAWFNENAGPGDICRFKSGDYGTTPIDPKERNTTSSSRIAYYGFPQDVGGVRVHNVQIGESAGRWGSNITVRWVTTTSAFSGIQGWFSGGVSPQRDSIVNCRSEVANEITVHGNYHVLDSLSLRGTRSGSGGGAWFFMGGAYSCDNPSTPSPNIEPCSWTQPITYDAPIYSNVIKNCTFNATLSYSGSNGGVQMFRFTRADSMTFFNNTVVCTVGTTTGYFFGLETYNVDQLNVQGNTWTFVMNSTPTGSHGFWSQRDLSDGNRYLSNTVTSTGSGASSFMLSNSGSWPGGNDSTYFGYNTIKVANPQASTGVFWFYDGSKTDTLEHNTISTSSTAPCLTIDGVDFEGMVVRHNTFFTNGPTAVDLTGASGDVTTPSRLTSNVYYCQTANSTTTPNVKVASPTQLDSAGVFFSLGSSTAANAILYGAFNGAPGSGGNFGGTRAQWCSPMLEDSTYATLDGRVTAAGCGVGDAWNDGYVGIGVSDADVTPPVVSITFPADTSYTWTGSETMPLTWTASDAVGVSSIIVQYGSTSDPAVEPTSWGTVTTLAGAATSYSWVMAGVSTRYGMVRIRAVDAAGNIGVDTQTYKFNVSQPPNRETFLDTP